MPSTFPDHIIDFEYIRLRRNELGMSRRQLADECGTTDRALLGLERGDNHSLLPLVTLARLAQALGVQPQELLIDARSAEADATASPHEARIEAALLHLRRHPRASHLRTALQLSENEWSTAVDRLRKRLATSGATLIAHTSGHCWIAAREGVLTNQELEALKQPERARTELTVQQARILKRIIDGETDVASLTGNGANASDLMAIGYLERNGFIRPTDDKRYLLTGEIAYSLGLNDIPPKAATATAPRTAPKRRTRTRS